MVALEAAAQGAEIVLTNDGAPKDTIRVVQYLVNPRSVDEIGQACMQALKVASNQSFLISCISIIHWKLVKNYLLTL
jgi:glycosyltransferase involved in cell wall biosynthesis